MPGMARWALAVLVVGMAGGLSEEDAGIELYLKQADTFISEPVSSKKACFVESSECRQSGSHWEPTRPVVMVFAPRGKERMVLGLLESCKRQDVVFRILAEDGAVVGFELEKLMRHKEISVETVHLNMSEPQEIMRSVERSFQQLLHYLPSCSIQGSEAAIAGGVCRAVRACLAGAREELKGLGGNGGGDVEQGCVCRVMAQLWDKIGRERRKYQQHESDGTRDVAAREVEDRRRDRGSKCGKREDAVVVIPVVYSQPEMLRTQVITFRKHLLDELELFVVIDASDDSMSGAGAQLEDVCKEMGVRYMAYGILDSWGGLVMLTEQDVFLVKAISLRELVRNDRKLPDKKRGREVESQETFDVSAAGAGAGAGAGADGDGGESDVAPFIAGYLQAYQNFLSFLP
ncbi:hypothetical protein GUITHDRAFT_138383 [Guillardia theta CCMP2712]|uniref:Glycosyltransferase 2-like domain-containing protein n=1 Tax=Guillardia theta (strain CCMP2712) TaxID=905079 RepID=L1JCR2_GUITC|nr:hypothetical protein GUITHDRAFT_138383 [Guillardia theta CCMP2712]EKX46286.1 hypothetical protein GUITHDRAFT_138383 [Guillardia theta CCMP2712]|eukprot:XP_005833266.1 hypothetical protein GUITHDRAFT_138383 [Guillardia theta CCMP2712]